MAYGAGLESQLGAIPQGFKSLILRQNNLILVKTRWRWDLNPRKIFLPSHAFEACTFGHSDTPPKNFNYFVEDLKLSLFFK